MRPAAETSRGYISRTCLAGSRTAPHRGNAGLRDYWKTRPNKAVGSCNQDGSRHARKSPVLRSTNCRIAPERFSLTAGSTPENIGSDTRFVRVPGPLTERPNVTRTPASESPTREISRRAELSPNAQVPRVHELRYRILPGCRHSPEES